MTAAFNVALPTFELKDANILVASLYLTALIALVTVGLKPWFNKQSEIRDKYSEDIDRVAATIEADHCGPLLSDMLLSICKKCSNDSSIADYFEKVIGTISFRKTFNKIYDILLDKAELIAHYRYLQELAVRLFRYHAIFSLVAGLMILFSLLTPAKFLGILNIGFFITGAFPLYFYFKNLARFFDRQKKLERGIDEILKPYSGITVANFSRR